MKQYTVSINTTRTVEANSIPDAIAIATAKIPPQDITVKAVSTASDFLAKLKGKEDAVEEKRQAVIKEIVSGFATAIANSERSIQYSCEYVLERKNQRHILVEMLAKDYTFDNHRPEFQLKFDDSYRTLHSWEHPDYDNGGVYKGVHLDTARDEIISQVLNLMKAKLEELGLKVSHEKSSQNYLYTIEVIRASW